jgi:hypothetical protein
MLRVLMFQLIRGYEDMSSTEGSGNCADILTRDWEGITVELHTPGNGRELGGGSCGLVDCCPV